MFLRGCLLSVLLVGSSIAFASDDDFLLDLVPTIMATLSCEEGQYQTCVYPGGCRRINGLWDDGICVAKSESRLNTELMIGRWYTVTSFSSGDFFNYFEYRHNSLKPIPSSIDFYLDGASFDTDEFNPAQNNEAIISYDSVNQDWFILDYWGRDVGTISSLEVNRISDNLFTGCEYYLNYPDLTYQDGICNPVRMTREGFYKESTANALAGRPVANYSKQTNSKRSALKIAAGVKFRPHTHSIVVTGDSNE